MKPLRWMGVLGIWLACFSTVQAASPDTETLIQANRAYQAGHFTEAREGYQRLLEQDPENGHLHYNMGNTCSKLGKPGAAIWHYLQAEAYLPRDEDIEANLQLVLRETADIWDGRRPPAAAALLFWLEDFNLPEHLLAFLVLNLAYWSISGISLTRENEGLERTKKIVAGLAAVALLACLAKGPLSHKPPTAVVIEKSLDAVTAQSQAGKVLYQFHEGAILSVLSESGSWLEIELPSGERGWVKKNGVLL